MYFGGSLISPSDVGASEPPTERGFVVRVPWRGWLSPPGTGYRTEQTPTQVAPWVSPLLYQTQVPFSLKYLTFKKQQQQKTISSLTFSFAYYLAQRIEANVADNGCAAKQTGSLLTEKLFRHCISILYGMP